MGNEIQAINEWVNEWEELLRINDAGLTEAELECATEKRFVTWLY